METDKVAVEQIDRELASVILDQDQWECGCENCHARLSTIIAKHRLSAEARSAGPVDVVEKVAEAMCAVIPHPHWVDLSEERKNGYRVFAQAAIAAIGSAGRSGVGEALGKFVKAYDVSGGNKSGALHDAYLEALAALSPQPTATEETAP